VAVARRAVKRWASTSVDAITDSEGTGYNHYTIPDASFHRVNGAGGEGGVCTELASLVNDAFGETSDKIMQNSHGCQGHLTWSHERVSEYGLH